MLTIETIKGDGRYFTDLAQVNYYTEGGEPPGFWLGKGSDYLGLKNQTVTQEGLQNILNGFHPISGKKLVQNAGKDNRQRGYDLTFSAPKSFSVLKAVAPEWIRKEMEHCFYEAVSNVVGIIEEQALFTRRGKKGTGIERATAVVAAFPHSSSRAEEPQDHIHCLFPNVCFREDLGTGTLYGQVYNQEDGVPATGWNPLLDFKLAAGSLLHLELSALLMKNLGFDLEPGDDNFSFRIKECPKEAEKHCSTRSKEIQAAKEEVGIFHGKAS